MKLIKKWILSILNNDYKNIKDLLSDNFIIEDGMDKQEYIDYEISQFRILAPIFDLTTNFYIKKINTFKLDDNKVMIYYLIINKFGKIVCKTQITLEKINNIYKVGSNNFSMQTVSKMNVKDEKIVNYGLAVKSISNIDNVISTDFYICGNNKGANYESDKFINIELDKTDKSKNVNFISMFNFKTHNKIEKKPVFFDFVDFSLKPYILDNNKLILIDKNYPVNIALFKNNEVINYEYPRGIIIDLNNRYDKIIITDCLDNDWIL